MRDLLGIARRDCKHFTVGYRRCLAAPAVECVDGPRGRRNHALNGGERATAAAHRNLDATVDRLCRGIGPERHLVHLHEMLEPDADGALDAACTNAMFARRTSSALRASACRIAPNTHPRAALDVSPIFHLAG